MISCLLRVLAGALLLIAAHSSAAAEPLRLSVAANFRATAERLAQSFRSATGFEATISSASTGVLATQIELGAPVDLFFSADSEAPARLLEKGIGVADSNRCYARGQLILLGADSLEALSDASLALSIANATTAPYGVAAEQVLAREAFSAARERRVIRGSNVLQAYQFFRAGGTELALVARSLVPDAGVPVPLEWYTPIVQHRLLIDGSNPAAAAFLDFVAGEEAAAILVAAGYLPCP